MVYSLSSYDFGINPAWTLIVPEYTDHLDDEEPLMPKKTSRRSLQDDAFDAEESIHRRGRVMGQAEVDDFIDDEPLDLEDDIPDPRELRRDVLDADPTEDPIRMYLMQMGQIPLLTRDQEVSAAKQIEKTRIRYRHWMLATDFMLRGCLRLLEQVRDKTLRLDRTIEVSVTNASEKKAIDLKLEPPAGLQGPELNQWLQAKPTQVDVDGKVLSGKDLVKWKYQRYMQDYLACVQGVDDGVGKVLDYLDESELAKNTIVIYSADNGWYLGDLGLYDKRFMYEPGLRVPLLARGPGIKAGSMPSQFVANIDLAPTFLDLAGIPVPESMQGHSLAPLLRGESPENWRTSVYYRYYHDPGHHNTAAHFGIRTLTHKLIYY